MPNLRSLVVATLLVTFSACVHAPKGQGSSAVTSSDLAVLELATKQCGLHDGALSFVQLDVPREPVIRMTRAYGDTQERLDCALKYFPEDFHSRFGVEEEIDAPR